MKANLTQNRAVVFADHEGSPEFREIFGGLGWADPQGRDHFASNWFVAIGVQFDETFTVILEESGTLSVLSDTLVETKDRLYLRKLFVNVSDPALTKSLKNIDGLFSYEIIGRHHNIPVWKHPEESWRSFRSRSHVAQLIPVRNEIISTPQIGLDLIHSLTQRNRFEIRHSCPRSSWLFRQTAPYTNLFRHPLFQAIVHSIYTFNPTSGDTALQTNQPTIPRLPRLGVRR